MSLNLKWWLEAGAEVVVRKGPFVVVNPPHRLRRCSILFYNGKKIGEIISKTFEEKYGTLDKWLRQVRSRSTKRLKKIDEQLAALEEEMESLKKLVEDVSMEISYD